jgi:hypothetical protein
VVVGFLTAEEGGGCMLPARAEPARARATTALKIISTTFGCRGLYKIKINARESARAQRVTPVS